MDAAEGLQYQEIVVTGDDDIGVAGKRGRKNNVIGRIATDASRQWSRLNHFAQIRKRSDRLQNCWRDEPSAPQRSDELSAKGRRPDDGAKVDRFFE